MKTIAFIFYWRLEREKGFDLVLDLISHLDSICLKKNVIFYIFGKWTLELNIKQKITKIQNINLKVEFFGWKDRQFIKKYILKSNYSLMPSRFLETFWLVALESLSLWVPVIWFAKWWLKQFIMKELDIRNQIWITDLDKLINLVLWLIAVNTSLQSNLLKHFEKKKSIYSLKNWMQSLNSICKLNSKKLLLVTDYDMSLWWIESYVYDLKKVLENNWNNVQIFWWKWVWGKLPWLLKFCFLWITYFNFLFAYLLKGKINKFSPNIIWFHSVSRFLWWLPIWSLMGFEWKKLMMYHDLWYFHPYPSKVYEEDQLSWWFSLVDYIKKADTKNILKLLLVIFKYFSNLLLRWQLQKKIDYHIVPSEFMVELLIRKYLIPKEKILVLPHFMYLPIEFS